MKPVNAENIPVYELDEENAWLIDTRRVVSPNCDERPPGTEVDLIVIHGISLPPRQYGGPYIDQLFTNALDKHEHEYFEQIHHLRVSSHLLIERNGTITQYVPFTQRAWHAGESCFGERQACNDFSIGIELEGCDEEAYTENQYITLTGVVRALQNRWAGICPDHIVGHCDIAPGRKTDPGPAFDWEYFSRKLSYNI